MARTSNLGRVPGVLVPVLLLACSSDPHSSRRSPESSASQAAGAPAAGADGAATAAAGGGGGALGSGGPTDAGTPALVGPPPHTFEPRPDLDPNAMFDWPQTAPGQGCQAGTYVGTFECELIAQPDAGLPPPPDGGTAFMLSGPITLRFEPSMDGEFLELVDAKLEGSTGLLGFTAPLSGRLDCTTLQLTAEAHMGQYGLGLPIGLPFGTFSGTLGGMLDTQNLLLSGSWSLGQDEMNGVPGALECVGPWMARFTP